MLAFGISIGQWEEAVLGLLLLCCDSRRECEGLGDCDLGEKLGCQAP